MHIFRAQFDQFKQDFYFEATCGNTDETVLISDINTVVRNNSTTPIVTGLWNLFAPALPMKIILTPGRKELLSHELRRVYQLQLCPELLRTLWKAESIIENRILTLLEEIIYEEGVYLQQDVEWLDVIAILVSCIIWGEPVC